MTAPHPGTPSFFLSAFCHVVRSGACACLHFSKENEFRLRSSFPNLHTLLGKLIRKYWKSMWSKVTCASHYLANFCSVIYHFIRFANLTFCTQPLFLAFKKTACNGSNLLPFRRAPSTFPELVQTRCCAGGLEAGRGAG